MKNSCRPALACFSVVTLASAGAAQNQLWIQQPGSSSFEAARAAAPDGSGGVYMSGWTDGNFGGPNAGGYDAWVARYCHSSGYQSHP